MLDFVAKKKINCYCCGTKAKNWKKLCIVS